MSLAGKPLSRRQAQILALIADGHRCPAIARMLVVSECTVRTHQSKLLEKLDARTPAHAVHLAHQRGDLTPAAGGAG